MSEPAATAPRVTVVIPTRDRRDLLARALGTVLAQRDVALEAVVVDDGSSDGTPAWVGSHPDPRVRLIAHERPAGVARARNDGIAAARAPWTAFLDDDDVWAPDKLSRQVAVASDGVALAYCGAVLVDPGLRMVGLRRTPDPGELSPAILDTNLVGTPSGVMAATAALRAAGGFDEDLGILADWDMWIRLLAHGGPACCPDPLLGYTVHPGNMHVADPARLRSELRTMRARHADACREAGVELGGERFSRWLVRRYRAAGRRRAAARVYVGLARRTRSPRDLGRAAGVLLGEGAMRRAGGEFTAEPLAPGPEPAWLADLRASAGSGGRDGG
ncbi:MAG: glycosyltransferase family 2 protein [Thermoleophilia bacterium]